ncbi:alpha/beta hydrolase [Bacillus sp. RG28]|uniref:Alpha/beta hydrolase n=1 Tax=Gottfriedia endophytica TaxID=2820819 RepID=A0A940NS98_9BACI|nr:alpha/beta hydrolase [Gottfriedia endophytica]MBP0726608.1 alpha/beta hydrolase [Gottfriedia endophytica]
MGHYIKVEKGVTLFVEDLGKGDPVVFIHGWPLNNEMFEYQKNQLINKNYRYIGIDLRGFGKSDHPFNGYTYDRMADDIRVVITKLKLKKITLAGFSMGGAIVIRYMARHQGYKVKKLLLISSAAPQFTKQPDFPYGFTKEEVTKLIKNIYQNRPKTLNEFGERFFLDPIDDQFRMWFNDLCLSASSHGTAFSAKALRDENVQNDLSKIKVPTAIFHGLQDDIVPYQRVFQLKDGIKNSDITGFEQSGHGVFFEELEKFNDELFSFLKD